MQTLKVEIISWKKSLVVVTLLALIHPTVYLCSDLLQGKPLPTALWKFGLIFAVYLIIDLFLVLRTLFSGQLREIIADESGLQLKAGHKSRRIAWTQISTLERSLEMEGKVLKSCLTLRDSGGQVLTRFFRELQETAETRTQFDQLQLFIAAKIGTHGVISAPLEARLKTAFALKTPYKLIGLGSLLFFLPCTFFSWNHPTGGPATGSIFLGFSVLGIFLALSDVKYEVDERGITRRSLFKKSELRWEEMRSVEMMRGAMSIRFASEKASLEVLGPANWGNDGALLMQFLQQQCEKYGVVLKHYEKVGWRDLFLDPKNRR